jgi:CRP/FNR family transcriptional regulator
VYYYWFKKAQKAKYLFFFIRFARIFLLKREYKDCCIDEDGNETIKDIIQNLFGELTLEADSQVNEYAKCFR